MELIFPAIQIVYSLFVKQIRFLVVVSSCEMFSGNFYLNNSMTTFCFSVKTILLRSSELGNCGTSERRPLTSIDFYLHCNGFLHCQDLFTRQRRKKIKQSGAALSAETKLFYINFFNINSCELFILPGKFKFHKKRIEW